MLIIQNITLCWSKAERNRKGAQERTQLPQAFLLETPPPSLFKQCQENPSGIVMHHIHFDQDKQKILDYVQHERKYYKKYLLEQGKASRHTKEKISYNISNMPNRQYKFCQSTKKIYLKNLNIESCEEPARENSCENSLPNFEVTFCYYNGAPIRHGHNKDYFTPHSPFYCKDLLNETAFILKPQQYGRILWNERLTYYDSGEWYYNLHCINFFYQTENTNIWEPAVFTKQQPDYIYKQMAQLR